MKNTPYQSPEENPKSDVRKVFERLSVTPRQSLKNIGVSFGLIVLGTAFATFGLTKFVLPNELLDGGVVGMALLGHQVLGGAIGMWIALISFPFLILGYFKVGKGFTFKSALGICLFILFIGLVPTESMTDERILAAIFGGCFIGAGVGITMRASAVLDGTEILALILNNKTPFAVGEIILIINVFIFTAAALLLDVEKALYSMLTYFCAAKMIDYVIHGFEAYNGITIITNHPDAVRSELLSEMRRGVTIYKGKGGYSEEEKQILYCVVTRLEVPAIKSLVQQIDPDAFLLVQTLNEASGGMFKRSTGVH